MDIVVSLIITIFIYLFIPICLIISGKKFKPSTIKKIAIINTVVCFIGLSAFTLAMANEPAGAGSCALLFFVAYRILEKRCLQDKQCAHCGADMPAKATVCDSCGCIDESTFKATRPKRSIGKTIGSIVAYLFVLGSVALNIYFYAQIDHIQSLRADDAQRIAELESKVEELTGKLNTPSKGDYWEQKLAELEASQQQK